MSVGEQRRKATQATKARAGHLPRRGLYALAAAWRKETDRNIPIGVSELERQRLIWERIYQRETRRECADALERAIARLPVDAQHLQAMLSFEQQSAEAIRRLEEVAGTLKIRLETVATTVNALLIQFNRMTEAVRRTVDKDRKDSASA